MTDIYHARTHLIRLNHPGARSLLYGSFLGLAAAAILVAAGARLFDVASPQDLRDRASADGPLVAEALQGWALPIKASIEVSSFCHMRFGWHPSESKLSNTSFFRIDQGHKSCTSIGLRNPIKGPCF